MFDNVNIGSRFMQRIIEKSIEKAVYKATGARIKIRFTDNIAMTTEDNMIKLHVSLDAETDKDNLDRLIESRG